MEIYELGNYLEVYDFSGLNPYVVKLTAVIKISDSLELLPFLEVEWSLKKGDLPKSSPEIIKYFSAISEAQVFPSSKKYYLPVDAIKDRCVILSQNAYQVLGLTKRNVYFSRADYNYVSGSVQPSFDKWIQACICKMPSNPDREYTQCDDCSQWFHVECVKKLKNDAVDCPLCKAKIEPHV